MSDAVLIREAAEIGLDERTIRLLPLFPLLSWVWSSGGISGEERARFLRIARADYELDEAALPLLQAWLDHAPAPGFSIRVRNLLIAIVRRQRGRWITPESQTELVDACRTVARGVTSLYSLRRLPRAEAEAISALAEVWTLRVGEVWPPMGADPSDESTSGLDDSLDPPTDVSAPLPAPQRHEERAAPPIAGPRLAGATLTRLDAGISATVEGAGEITIGRTRGNTLQILDDGEVSRHHCRIHGDEVAWFVEDLGSMNGTRVNGELVRRRQLRGGEELVIGSTIYRVDLRLA